MSNGYEYFLRFILCIAFGYGIVLAEKERENRS
jgi:hypothetical protein